MGNNISRVSPNVFKGLSLSSPDGSVIVKQGNSNLYTKTLDGFSLVNSTVNATSIGATTRSTARFTTLDASGNSVLGTNTSNTHTVNGSLTITNTATTKSISADGNITASGNVTAFSDTRFKKDWVLPKGLLSKTQLIQRGTYTRVDSGERQCGISAQDLQSILPEAVVTSEEGTLSVAYGNAALVLVLELIDEVNRLKKIIEG